MNFITDLSNSELEYICAKIPSKAVSNYFQRHPKDFQKIRPGFRAKSLKPADLSRVLLENCDAPFILTFLNDTIHQYLNQIEDYFQGCIRDGANTAKAYIDTLSNSYFSENVPLYVKLAGKDDLTKEAIEFIEAAIQFQEELEIRQQIELTAQEQSSRGKTEIEKKLRAKDKELSKLSARLDKSEKERLNLTDQIIHTNAQLQEKTTRLFTTEASLAETQELNKKQKNRISELEQRSQDAITQLEGEKLHVDELKTELAAMHEADLQRQLQKREARLAYAPDDLDEFYECFEYNLSSIGIDNSDDYKDLLIQYLGKILFRGIPILINHGVAATIAQCLSNTLTGRKEYDVLLYYNGIKSQDIEDFLNSAGRVICLDGFIGNFNELELLPVVELHRDKIIFLSTTSERTITYLANDVLLRCTYFNANRTGKLLRACNTDEDGTTLDEHPVKVVEYCPDERIQKTFDEIAQQCHLPESLIELWKLDIQTEEDLCQVLAFTALPYCADALYLRPYNASPRLQRYAGKAGRCPHRELLVRWFGRE